VEFINQNCNNIYCIFIFTVISVYIIKVSFLSEYVYITYVITCFCHFSVLSNMLLVY
jgi:hypothetical protein